MAKLVVVIMGQDCEKFIKMCLESVKDADAIVYCDGGGFNEEERDFWWQKCYFCGHNNSKECDDESTDWCELNNFPEELICNKCGQKLIVITNPYDQDDPKMNGKQRNFYLDYIKENYSGWYCLCLDADEVLSEDGIKNIKEFVNGR